MPTPEELNKVALIKAGYKELREEQEAFRRYVTNDTCAYDSFTAGGKSFTKLDKLILVAIQQQMLPKFEEDIRQPIAASFDNLRMGGISSFIRRMLVGRPSATRKVEVEGEDVFLHKPLLQQFNELNLKWYATLVENEGFEIHFKLEECPTVVKLLGPRDLSQRGEAATGATLLSQQPPDVSESGSIENEHSNDGDHEMVDSPRFTHDSKAEITSNTTGASGLPQVPSAATISNNNTTRFSARPEGSL